MHDPVQDQLLQRCQADTRGAGSPRRPTKANSPSNTCQDNVSEGQQLFTDPGPRETFGEWYSDSVDLGMDTGSTGKEHMCLSAQTAKTSDETLHYVSDSGQAQGRADSSPDFSDSLCHQSHGHTELLVKRSSGEVPWSSCAFLAAGRLLKLPAEDKTFLRRKGCLSVPDSMALEEFIRQSFLHVHPFLPLINENEFWATYSNRGFAEPEIKVSLVVFQAMLFTSCSVLTPSSHTP